MPDTAPTALPIPALLAIVILLSLALTGYELFKIFNRDFGRALGNRYALLLGVLNILTALLVWWVIHSLLAIQPSLLSALITGLTFPALLRSRFTLYRSLSTDSPGQVDELSLKMDEIYQSLQQAFYREVNLQLTAARLKLSSQIRETFTERALSTYLSDFIVSERLPQERERHRRELEQIMAIEEAKTRHLQLANLLLDLKTTQEIKTALRHKSLTAPD